VLVIGMIEVSVGVRALTHGYLNHSCYLSMLPCLTNSNSCLGRSSIVALVHHLGYPLVLVSSDGIDIGILQCDMFVLG